MAQLIFCILISLAFWLFSERGVAANVSTVSRIGVGLDNHKKVYEDSDVFARLGKTGGLGVILIPGGEVAANRYVELAQEIVDQEPEVSVFVARFTRDYVTPWETGPKIKAILATMERLGWRQPASSTYLAAHSMGGIFAHSEVEASKLQGLILLASYLPEATIGGAPYTVTTFKRPILILGAEWDRRVDLHVQSRAFAEFDAWHKKHPNDRSKYVGVLAGASHMQFADGELLASDVPPTRSTAEVRAETAKLITAFLRLQDRTTFSASDRQSAASLMEELVKESRDIFSTVVATDSLDKSACSWLQSKMVPVQPSRMQFEGHIFSSYGAFALARPKLDDKGVLRVPTHLERPPNPFDLPGTPFGIPVALSCKFSLPKIVESSRFTQGNRCKEADRLLAEAVADILTKDQKERIESSRSQLNLVSHRVSTWAQWLVTPTGFRHMGDATQWESRSVSWEESDRQGDIVSCKLTPPTRWLFYYLRDAHLTSLENSVRL